jgi:hypothetical protein
LIQFRIPLKEQVMDRRQFLQAASATLAAATIASSSSLEAAEKSPKTTKKEKAMNIVVAADPFALDLKDSVIKHLTEAGHKVTDVGATKDKEIAYYDGAAAACKVIQAGKADRGVLFCGTGMGMSIVANKFKGVTASCVESVYAADVAGDQRLERPDDGRHVHRKLESKRNGRRLDEDQTHRRPRRLRRLPQTGSQESRRSRPGQPEVTFPSLDA